MKKNFEDFVYIDDGDRGQAIEVILKEISAHGLKIDGEIFQSIIDFAPVGDYAKTKANEIKKFVGVDDVIHPVFNNTTTGRYCTAQPNVQNTPKTGSKFAVNLRQAIIPREGNIFVHADISQAELRVLAHFSKDEKLKELLSADGDVHRLIASHIFGCPADEVSDFQRGQAKTVVYAMTYGGSIGLLSKRLRIDTAEAKRIRDVFFSVFPVAKKWIDKAKKNKAPKTISGRIIPSAKPSTSVNYPLQGSVADIVNKAIICLYSKFGVQVVYQGYDAIVCEVPKNKSVEVQGILQEAIQSSYPLDVPVNVKITTGSNFNEIMPVVLENFVLQSATVKIQPIPQPKEKKTPVREKAKTIDPRQKTFDFGREIARKIAGDVVDILPNRPYCTDKLVAGVRIEVLGEAIQRLYMQVNQSSLKHFLLFDVDVECQAGYAQTKNLPVPTYQVNNPENNHAHLFYRLESPVCISEYAKIKPLLYASAIEKAYTVALMADVGFAGLIVKNPWNTHWVVEQNLRAIYELGKLAEYVNLEPPSKFRYSFEEDENGLILGMGRNCSIFYKLRTWSYYEIKKYWNGNFESWKNSVIEQAQMLNIFTGGVAPLALSEVSAIAHSTAKWTWKNFDKEIFSEIQSARRAKRIGQTAEYTDKREKALALYEIGGLSKSEICRACGISRPILYAWLKADGSGQN